ncbi:MAG: hypothetical protein VCC68_12080 [Myxococcota bacterium]
MALRDVSPGRYPRRGGYPVHQDPDAAASPSLARRLEATELAMLLLLLLSGLGIGVSDYSADQGLVYWLAMVPVFGTTCLVAGWSTARARGQSAASVIRTQLLHWGGLAGALWLLFLLADAGRINNADLGLVSLVLLALSTFLVGVHGDWRFCLVGIVLAGTAILAGLVEQYLWLGLVPVVTGIGVFAYWRLRRH